MTSWTTPPTFTPGEVLTSSDQTIISGDLSHLYTAHGCIIWRNGASTIPNNTQTTILWDSETTDTDAYHSVVSNDSRITIPSGLGGTYEVSGVIGWASNSSGYRAVKLLKNGSIIKNIALAPTTGGGTQAPFTFWVSALVATDYLEVAVVQTSGAGLALSVGDDTVTWTSAYWRGA